jgi:TonB family protein
VVLSSAATLQAQSPTDPSQPVTVVTDPSKTTEALQTRIERARALIAAHRLETAASELESVRVATPDYSIRSISSVMLMSVYLEEGNYARAESLLEETFQARSAQKDESLGNYFALAGQAVNGARTHLARYRSFGVNTSDTNLPAEATSDLDRLRTLLERMIAQAKDISSVRRGYDSLSLLEDVLGIRLSLARDAEDQVKWEAEYAGARQALASSQTQIASLGGIPALRPGRAPLTNVSSPSPYSTKKVSEPSAAVKTPEQGAESVSQPAAPATDRRPDQNARSASRAPAKQAPAINAQPSNPEVTNAGSLNAKATKRVLPRYPPIAKQSGAAGLVRVHVIIDETGKVVAISKSEGPVLLRQAAEDAARQWSFQSSPDASHPARRSGYIEFNFTL